MGATPSSDGAALSCPDLLIWCWCHPPEVCNYVGEFGFYFVVRGCVIDVQHHHYVLVVWPDMCYIVRW